MVTDQLGIRPEHVRFLPEWARTVSPNGGPSDRPVPLRGLLISAGALVVAVLVSAFFTDSIEANQDLGWSLAILPALLLAYHKGWKRVTWALAVGLAVLWSAYAVGYTLSLPIADWPAFLPVISAFIAISLGSGWMSEARASLVVVPRKLHSQRRGLFAHHRRATWRSTPGRSSSAVSQRASSWARSISS